MRDLAGVQRLIGEKLGLSPENLRGNIVLTEVDWDSLDFLELAVALENEFDIKLVDENFCRCRTVEEVAELIAAALRV